MQLTEERLIFLASEPSETEIKKIEQRLNAVKDSIDRNLDTMEITETHKLSIPFRYRTFLQGSFGNKTNIRSESDVDIVVLATSVFTSNKNELPPEQLALHDELHPVVNYSVLELKQEVFVALQKTYGESVKMKSKCIEIRAAESGINADVIPAVTYRAYKRFLSYADAENCLIGMQFINSESGCNVINFPELHMHNCNLKNEETKGKFKGMVRIFKTLRCELIESGELEEGQAPSYFIENLLYNCSGSCYEGGLQQSLLECLQFIDDAIHRDRITGFVCANEQDSLISDTTWNVEDIQHFIEAIESTYLQTDNE